MAKKQAASAKKSKAAPRPAKKVAKSTPAAAGEAGTPASPAEAKAAKAPAMKPKAAPKASAQAAVAAPITNEAIGLAAGEVWGLLAAEGPQSLANLHQGVSAPAELVFAALGWLAREDKLEFAASGRTVTVSLR